ncbi:MAG TPA: hypothetical protein ENN07_04395 [candidate division Zixibacteria bacterium]|nr:hypothetical protein [candidate division Zixibacteria bacterium]
MTVKCPKCGSDIRVPDAEVARGTVDVLCPICAEKFRIEGSSEESIPRAKVVKLPSGKTSVVCPSCDKSFIINPSKIGDRPAKTTCLSCKKPFIVQLDSPSQPSPAPLVGGIVTADQLSKEYLRDKVASPEPTRPVDEPPPVLNDPPPVRRGASYFVYRDGGERTGPFDLPTLRSAVASGELSKNDIVEEPTGDIRPAGEIGGLIPAFEALRKSVSGTHTQDAVFQDILAGALSGLGAGLALALLGLLTAFSLDIGLVAGYARIVGGLMAQIRNPALAGFLVVMFVGVVLGISVSAAKNFRKRNDEDYWKVSTMVLIGAIVGLALGLISAIFAGGISYAIYGIGEGAILGFLAAKLFARIRPLLESD